MNCSLYIEMDYVDRQCRMGFWLVFPLRTCNSCEASAQLVGALCCGPPSSKEIHSRHNRRSWTERPPTYIYYIPRKTWNWAKLIGFTSCALSAFSESYTPILPSLFTRFLFLFHFAPSTYPFFELCRCQHRIKDFLLIPIASYVYILYIFDGSSRRTNCAFAPTTTLVSSLSWHVRRPVNKGRKEEYRQRV